MVNKSGYLFMDVDGTLTDGKIYMGNTGEEFKAFNIKDGYGIYNILLNTSIIPVIVTGRKSLIVENRCKELGMTYIFQDVGDKKLFIEDFLSDRITSINYNIIAYIGDDLNDLEAMRYIKEIGGVVGCPCDAVNSILEIADYVSNKGGGNGAVRDFIEFLIQ